MASSLAPEPERSFFDVHTAWLRKPLGERADRDRFVLVFAQAGSRPDLGRLAQLRRVIAVYDRRPCCPNGAMSRVSLVISGARVGHAAAAGTMRCWA